MLKTAVNFGAGESKSSDVHKQSPFSSQSFSLIEEPVGNWFGDRIKTVELPN